MRDVWAANHACPCAPAHKKRLHDNGIRVFGGALSVKRGEKKERTMNNKIANLVDKQDDVTTKVILITPDMAQSFLAVNHPRNRPINWGRVDAIAGDIVRGAWRRTHQGICFDRNGVLIDGQTRLHAIVRSGIAVKMLVVYDQDGEFESPIDRQRPRSLSNISGRPTREVATIGVLKQLEAGCVGHIPSTLEDLDVYGEHHRAALDKLWSITGSSRLQAGACAALVWALPVSEPLVVNWAEAVHTGEMLHRGHAAMAFRRWSELRARIRPTSWQLAMATFNCLRHHLSGLRLTAVYVGESGYRAITAQRRALGIPHTPDSELVPHEKFKPTRGEELTDEPRAVRRRDEDGDREE